MSFDFSGKKILVAGGTGFIGRRVVKLLIASGANVHIITRKKMESNSDVTYLQADLNDKSSLQGIKQSYDVCVYMAAYIPEVGQKKETYLEAKISTLDPLINFCEVFSDCVKQCVYVSSIDTLGVVKQPYYDEMQFPNVSTPYGLAKYCGEFYVKSYCENNNVKWCCLRFSQVFGSYEPIVRIIPIMKKALLNGDEFSLYTDGKEKRRFLYVDDAALAICTAISKSIIGTFNIAGKEVTSMEELVHIMEDVYGEKMKLSILNKAIGNDNIPSIEKAERELGFIPHYSLIEGIKKMKEEEENGAI